MEKPQHDCLCLPCYMVDGNAMNQVMPTVRFDFYLCGKRKDFVAQFGQCGDFLCRPAEKKELLFQASGVAAHHLGCVHPVAQQAY